MRQKSITRRFVKYTVQLFLSVLIMEKDTESN
jgi:hypothetical protein